MKKIFLFHNIKMYSNNETLNTSSVKLRKSEPDIQLIPTGSRSSAPINLASSHNSTTDNLTPNNLIPESLTPNNLTPADNLNLIPNIRPHTVQLDQFNNLSFNPEPIQVQNIWVFFSSRSLKTRKKILVLLSLYIF